MNSKMFHSSPIRGQTALEEIEETQRNRASQLYHPMSSPNMKAGKNQKQKQMEDLRERRRQFRLELNREKVTDIESYNKQLQELQEQADALEVDPDELIEDVDDEYAKQLEDYLADAERELEQQLKDLQIDDNSTNKQPGK